MKKRICLYNHDFEFVVNEIGFVPGKYVASVNYLGYPDAIAIDYGVSEQEAIENAVLKMLNTNSLEAVKNIH